MIEYRKVKIETDVTLLITPLLQVLSKFDLWNFKTKRKMFGGVIKFCCNAKDYDDIFKAVVFLEPDCYSREITASNIKYKG